MFDRLAQRLPYSTWDPEALRAWYIDALKFQLIVRDDGHGTAFVLAADGLTIREIRLTLTDNAIATVPKALGERPALQKLMLAGNQLRELPESLAQLHNLELLRIAAVVWVEREGQKPIVIGKGGERMKAISTGARMGMERLFGRKVFLETWCRVREGWSDDEAALRRFGYSD